MARRLLAALAMVLAVTGSGAAVSAPEPRPGNPSDHTWLFGEKLLWEPCGPLTYRVNPAKAPRAWKRTLRTAFKNATRSSGIRFRYIGKTREKVSSATINPDDTDIMIAFVTRTQTDLLPGQAAGGGGSTTDGQTLFDGRIAFNGPVLKKMSPGFGVGPRNGIQGTAGQVVMHEIGHVLGLGHARSQTQIMFPAATRKRAVYGAGDHQGLRILGRGTCGGQRTVGPMARLTWAD